MKKQPYPPPGPTHKQEPEISVLSILVLSLFIGLIAGAGVDKSHILPIACIAAIVLLVNRKKIAAGETATQAEDDSQPSLSVAEGYYAWPKREQFAVTVRGELYQEVIRQLVQENAINAKADPDSKAYILQAYLIPDNDNPYNSSAVRVDINNRTVGYLNQEEACNFRHRLNEKKLANQITICNAIITGSEVDRETFNYDVKLDMESLS